MEMTGSGECRQCHNQSAMALQDRTNRARVRHEGVVMEGKTCIDFHKGIAHKPVHKELEKEKNKTHEQCFTLPWLWEGRKTSAKFTSSGTNTRVDTRSEEVERS